MNKQKVLITGVSGFIGSPLAKALAKQECEVLAISRKVSNLDAQLNLSWLEADLNDPESYRSEIESFGPEVLIHLAWQDIPDFSFKKSLSNLDQSLGFLSFIVGLKSCKKILVSGSCWEYNRLQGECLETDIVESNNHFTWAKMAIRLWLEMATEKNGIVLSWFRIFYVYGPGQRSEALIPKILNDFKSGKSPQIKTPKSANDYIFIDDVVDAFILATRQKIPSGTYNLGSGEATSVLDICRAAELVVLGSQVLTQKIETDAIASGGDINFWAGIEETKKKLNWQPKITIARGIQNTWNYINKL